MTILIIVLLTNDVYGQTVYLPINNPAPYSGFLFTPAKTEELRKDLIAYDGLKIINQSLERSLALSVSNLGLTKQQVDLLTIQNQKLIDERTIFTSFQKYAYIGSGILGTALSVYLASLLRK